MSSIPLAERVRAALQSVSDPEIGESIVELGLVARIEVVEAEVEPHVEVVLIATSATCPMADVLIDDATHAVDKVLPDGWQARVWLDFEQPWSPQRMSPELQERFGWNDDGRG